MLGDTFCAQKVDEKSILLFGFRNEFDFHNLDSFFFFFRGGGNCIKGGEVS